MSFPVPGRKPISIKDIARQANVSHSTVSRALRNSPLVHPDTAEKIREIATSSGYRVSAVARSLVSRRTQTIGVVVTTIADPFNAEVVSGIEDVANAFGYSVFLASSQSDPVRELGVVHSFAERRVDGIIVNSSRVGSLYQELLSSLSIPVVFINNHNPGGFAYSVSIDDVAGARQITEHLLGLGHTRLAYIGDRFGLQSNLDRMAGFQDVIERAPQARRPARVVYGDGTSAGGAQAMGELLASNQAPTAVFCYNDRTAQGALSAIHEHGLRVPEDISVAGFDDLPVSSFCHPPLTTLRQPMNGMGRQAMEILEQLLSRNPKAPDMANKFVGDLIIRRSTGVPSIGKQL
ncbi:MAG: LacI family DNA-binding transcriptional regulator [Acidobacteriia bacterium]|nr:LacI family DNA-binding transcriptional regulator [Terriglobia bacterium]